MKYSNIYLCCSLLLGLAACSDGSIVDEQPTQSTEINHISAKVEGYGALTRSELYRQDNAINFRWSAGDKLGIFPDTGSQVYFAIDDSQAGSLEAFFDGGGWALKKAHSYVAYFPFQNDPSLEKNDILLDFTGQAQTGDASYSHLGQYDFLASDAVAPLAGELSFTMNHQASILILQITVPEAGDYKYCKLSADSEVFTTLATLNISGNSPIVTSKEKSKSISLELNNVKTTSANEVITLSMMVYPVDLTSKTITVSLYEKGGNVYTGNIDETKNLEKGKPYQMTANLTFDRIDSHGVILFADNNVKSICLANWDTNGDSELSLYEAANVTSINTVFANRTNILSFNEFKYFTNVQYVTSYSFKGCTNLESIELPESIKMINSNAFYECTKLKNVILNDNLANIGASAFYGCSNLETIKIPAKVNTIGSQAFYNCSKLRSIAIPDGVVSIPSSTFYQCSSLNKVSLPSTLTAIGAYAFSGCSNLAGIEIPTKVNQIDYQAFQYCTNLLEITLPEGLKEISSGLLKDCTNLLKVSIPSSVTVINNAAFENCSNLIEVRIPENVISFGKYAFYNCKSLTKITLLGTTVPSADNTTFGETNNCPIYVPAVALNDYKSAGYPWYSHYQGRIQAIP